MRITRLAFAVSALVVLAQAAFAQQAPVEQPPLITVTGNGVVRADPDMATVRLGVQAQAKNAKDAQAQVNATATKILDAVTKLGIDKKNIQTGSLTLYPVYGQARPNDGAQTLTGFRAQNTVIVRLTDLAKVGPVVDASVAAGANEIQSVDFGLLNDASARKEALKKAVAEAREKAVAMAEALGLKVGAVYEMVEGGAQVMPMPMARSAFAGDAMVGAPVMPGQLDVSASVTIRFRIG